MGNITSLFNLKAAAKVLAWHEGNDCKNNCNVMPYFLNVCENLINSTTTKMSN